MLEHTHALVRQAGESMVALASAPLLDGDRLHGALGVSWSGPVELGDRLRGHLEEMGRVIGARLSALDPPPS